MMFFFCQDNTAHTFAQDSAKIPVLNNVSTGEKIFAIQTLISNISLLSVGLSRALQIWNPRGNQDPWGHFQARRRNYSLTYPTT